MGLLSKLLESADVVLYMYILCNQDFATLLCTSCYLVYLKCKNIPMRKFSRLRYVLRWWSLFHVHVGKVSRLREKMLFFVCHSFSMSVLQMGADETEMMDQNETLKRALVLWSRSAMQGVCSLL